MNGWPPGPGHASPPPQAAVISSNTSSPCSTCSGLRKHLKWSVRTVHRHFLADNMLPIPTDSRAYSFIKLTPLREPPKKWISSMILKHSKEFTKWSCWQLYGVHEVEWVQCSFLCLALSHGHVVYFVLLGLWSCRRCLRSFIKPDLYIIYCSAIELISCVGTGD